MLVIKTFEETPLDNLIKFRDALSQYIVARQYMESDTFQSEQALAQAHLDLEKLEAELKKQTTLVESLKKQLIGNTQTPAQNISENESDALPTPAQNNHNHNGHGHTQLQGKLPATRTRKYMCDKLGISRATLYRWEKSFSDFLSQTSRDDYRFTSQDEEILLKIKTLRDKKYDTQSIIEELKA